MRAVIVEDMLDVAVLHSQYVTKTPELSVAAMFYSAREALDFLLKNPVDLILLDITMTASDYSGLNLLADLRRQNKKVDAIIISSSDSALDVDEAFHLGVVDYLIKPFTYERFHEAIQKFLLRHSMQSKGKYTQEDIDRMTKAIESTPQNFLRKGLQLQTLEKIWGYMQENVEKYLTSDKIAEDTGFSKMTIRRYMNYLIEEKKISSRTNYSTGGRPSIEYIFIDK